MRKEYSFAEQARLLNENLSREIAFSWEMADILSQPTTSSNEFTKELIRRLHVAEKALKFEQDEHRRTLQSIASLAGGRR